MHRQLYLNPVPLTQKLWSNPCLSPPAGGPFGDKNSARIFGILRSKGVPSTDLISPMGIKVALSTIKENKFSSLLENIVNYVMINWRRMLKGFMLILSVLPLSVQLCNLGAYYVNISPLNFDLFCTAVLIGSQ